MYRRQVSSFSEKLKSRILRPAAEGSTAWARQHPPGTPGTFAPHSTAPLVSYKFCRVLLTLCPGLYASYPVSDI